MTVSCDKELLKTVLYVRCVRIPILIPCVIQSWRTTSALPGRMATLPVMQILATYFGFPVDRRHL